MRFSIKQVAGLVVSIALWVTIYSYIVSQSRFSPTVEALGQDGYNYAWTCIRAGGVAMGVTNFFILSWITRRTASAKAPKP